MLDFWIFFFGDSEIFQFQVWDVSDFSGTVLDFRNFSGLGCVEFLRFSEFSGFFGDFRFFWDVSDFRDFRFLGLC